jgi:IclR family KDG regulon transcriptional repressor
VPQPPSPRPDKGRLSSVASAVRLLKAFSEEQVEIGISDLAKRLGVAKSTVHRLAVTMVADNMLEQNPDTGKYRLGIALFRLGSLVRQRMSIYSEARPLLRGLREKVNETMHLAVLDGSEIMYVYNLESTQAIRMRSDVGVRKPAYCTAEGQAILAFQPAEVFDRVVRQGLPARTPQTITDPLALRKALDGVRARGCAIEDEESELGMRCIAAPLRNDTGEVVAAIGLGGPVSRLSKKALVTFIPHVIETAGAISARLGHRGRMPG